MSEPFIGQITLFAGNYAPQGWFFCDGSTLPIQAYSALYAVIGITYGGNGSTNFMLPDLRGRVPIQPGQGAGLSVYTLAQKSGAEYNTLTVDQLPAHTHLLAASSLAADQAGPGNHVLATEPTGSTALYHDAPTDVTLHPASIQSTGTGQPISNVQPFLGLNYIIAYQGIFPVRG